MGNSLKKKDSQNFVIIEDEEQYKRPEKRAKTEVQDGGPDPLEGFNVHSEFSEAPIKVRPLTEEEKNQPEVTNVTVYTDKDIKKVDPADLNDFIKNNTDIRKVVVEKIGVEEANRVEVLYDKKKPSEVEEQKFKKFNYTRRSDVDYISEEQETHRPREIKIDFKELDRELNSEFLQSSPEIKNEKRDEIKEKPESHLNFNKEFEEKSDKKFVFKSKFSEEEKLENEVDGQISKFEASDEEKELKKLSYEKHTLSKKRGKQHNGFYYKAKDHVELFKTGSQYLKDFKEGLKSFAFSSYDLDLIRQKTVFGVSTFFNYHTDVKTLIVSEGVAHSFYNEYMGIEKNESRQVFDEDITYDVGVTNGIELMDFEQLRKVSRKIRTFDFEDFVDFLVDSYDLILWDMPEVSVLDNQKEVYFPIIRSLDSVSLIVAKDKTKIKEVHELVGYYKRYQVEIKGLLYNPDGTEYKKKGA
ncbi:MAG: hypothetical protein CME70_15750 [Halobacteriovorax sp.]|nr:hypothetical protein [Halobacteriovorax sp.]|tara:strand:- start:14506 stop:15912 length:1407 start_codon:yes stop_codon:yes gene_type:complete